MVSLAGHTRSESSVAEELVMKEAPGFNRRRFCGAAAATVAASPLGLFWFSFNKGAQQ
jgi:hypothetical protein